MKASELIIKLTAEGVKFQNKNNRLMVKAPSGVITQEISELIKTHKDEITRLVGNPSTRSTIQPADHKPHYPLSSAQKRLYFLHQFAPESLGYNMPQILKLEGKVDQAKIQDAFQNLIARHESLRTHFVVIDEIPFQKIAHKVTFNVTYLESTTGEALTHVQNFIQPFELSQSPLIRVGLIALQDAENEHIMMIDMHHIITDGASQRILIKDLMSFYNGEELPEIRVCYKDYTEWQLGHIYQETLESHRSFWLNQFSDELVPLELATDFPRSQERHYVGLSSTFHLSHETVAGLKSLAEQQGSTLFMVLLSAYYILLSKLSNQEDIVIGTPTAGRSHSDLEDIVGMFVNTLPLRNYPKGASTYKEFLHDMQARTLSSFNHQDYQYEELIDELKIKRDLSRNSLFDVMFAYQNFDKTSLKIPGVKLSPYDFKLAVSKFDLTLTAVPSEDGMVLQYDYASDLFKQETILRINTYFEHLLHIIITRPNGKISSFEIITAAEREYLLHDFNNTQADFDLSTPIIRLIEQQVERTPTRIATIHKSVSIDYITLNQKANYLAQELLKQGVTQNAKVPILMSRGIDYMIAFLAVNKVGACCTPLSIDWPEERIIDILSTLGSSVVLINSDIQGQIEFRGTANPVLVNQMNLGSLDENPELKIDTDAPMVMFHTSGTTGTPKGVILPHKGILNRLLWMNNYFGEVAAQTVLRTTKHIFDSSLWQLFWPLINGGKSIIPSSDTPMDLRHFLTLMQDHQVTMTDFVPSLFGEMVNEITSERVQPSLFNLKEIVIGGEAITVNSVNAFRKTYPDIRLTNLYGPTEASIGCVYYPIDGGNYQSIPIGRPISNTKVHILDPYGNLSPTGVNGELHITGVGLAQGYFNLPELTLEKFIDNPFETGQKLYKTGDLARWTSDGNIEFIGRVDDQIKIRGFRIEPTEIACQLANHDQIQEVAVMAKGEGNDKHLVGYYLSEELLDPASLKEYLSVQLPDYMVPDYFVHLTKFPLTVMGKLDKKSLPEPEIEAGEDYVGPADETEKQLVQLWSEVLKREPEVISVMTNFFEIGGHSLRATVVVNKIRKQLRVDVSLRDFFKYADIRSLAKHVRSQDQLHTTCIPKAQTKAHYSLSSAQQRQYFLQQYDLDAITYNMPQVLRLKGELNLNRLQAAFQGLVNRHDSFRTRFVMLEEEPVQVIEKTLNIELEFVQTSNQEETSAILSSFIRPFDLTVAPLIRAGLVKFSDKEHILLTDMHHIISDGVSMDILQEEFIMLYNGAPLPDLPLQYKDYSEWQQGEEARRKLNNARAFWLAQYETIPETLNLPVDYARPEVRNAAGDTVNFRLSSAETKGLKQIAKSEGTTMFMLILSVFNVLLSRLSNQQDIVIGTPTAGRFHDDLAHIVGMFVNTLPLRNYASRDKSFTAFLQEVKDSTLSCFDHQNYQYEELINELEVSRDTGHNPLFDVMYSYSEVEVSDTVQASNVKASPYEGKGTNLAKFDLSLFVLAEEGQLTLSFNYTTDLFERSTIERFTQYFKAITSAIIYDQNASLADIKILPEAEEEQLLVHFNHTEVEYPAHETVLSLFTQQAHNKPEKVALRHALGSMTYKELDRQSDQVAAYLNSQHFGQGHLIGLMLEREPIMIAFILGVFKAGAAYVPISPDYPLDRVQFIVDDAQLSCLVCRKGEPFATLATELIDLDKVQNEITSTQLLAGYPTVAPADPAYVIYTSGSTGKPKGVLVDHGALYNIIRSQESSYPMEEGSYLLKTTFTFDVSCTELFGWFFSGGSLTMLPPTAEGDPDAILQCIDEHHITHINFVPSMFSVFLDTLEHSDVSKIHSLKYLFLAGETLPVSLVRRFVALGTSIHLENIYGPTETTIYSCGYSAIHLEAKSSVPIGKPLDNIKLYVLNDLQELQPLGVAGELYIGGKGLAKGYLNDETLTRKRFIDNPFRTGERMYRTGDLARWLPEGIVEYLGRVDDQIKLRGYRIEPGEIETKLSSHKAVNEAVVLAKGDGGDQYLVGYYVSEEALEATVLTHHLSERLPAYMVPNHFVHLESLPLSKNGKLDKTALPAPELAVNNHFLPPSGEVEAQLQKLWSQVLKVDVEVISVTANFFELGGHSLRATVLVNKILQELGVEVPLRIFFQLQDIRSLGNYIIDAEKAVFQSIKLAAVQDSYPLSSAQQRMYFLHRFNPSSLIYNMPQVIRLNGEVNHLHLEQTFHKLIARHESLRTSFEVVAEVPVQKIATEIDFELEYYESDEDTIQEIIDSFIRPFDLSKAPLIRVGLISGVKHYQDNPSSFTLMVDMPHIISDGVSQGVLIKDFMTLYNNGDLTPLSLHYKDYAVWQQAETQQTALSSQKAFWLGEFPEKPLPLELPYDHRRPLVKKYQGGHLNFTLDSLETKKLRALAASEDATLFMAILSVFNILLSKLGNQEDIVVGTPTAGRPHADLTLMIGMFVNTLPLRNYPKGKISFREFLSDVQSRTLACFDSQDYQYEELIDELKIERDTSRNPLFDVMFSYQNFEESQLEIPGLRLTPLSSGLNISKFDLTLKVSESTEQLHLSFEYSRELFEQKTIEKFTTYFQKIVEQVVSNSEVVLSEIEVITEQEREQLIDVFNETALDYPKNKTAIDLFEEQVRKTPDTTALASETDKVSYEELNDQANTIAHSIIKRLPKADNSTIIGLLFDPSIAMVASMLGILKVGCTYIPLSTTNSTERNAYILADSKAKLLLVQDDHEKTHGEFPSVQGTSIVRVKNEERHQKTETLTRKTKLDELIYVIYTSGTTGKPKGVEVKHSGLVNMLHFHKQLFKTKKGTHTSQVANSSFDASAFEIWPALTSGACLHIAPSEVRLDPVKMKKWLIEHKVELTFQSTAMAEYLLKEEWNKNEAAPSIMNIGGDRLNYSYNNSLPFKIFNLYGPTEDSIWTTYSDITKLPTTHFYSIGKPIANKKIYILNKYHQLQPIGVKGELCIAGHGLARGYVNDPNLTQEKFIDSPFGVNEKLYKTGDLARWRADGNIEFIGRVDDQVKIRGFRIEPGEIEYQLANHHQIKEAVISVKDHLGEKYLIAYYVSKQAMNTQTLKDYLAKKLPDYMVPAHYVSLAKLPLNSSGKVDKKALPGLELNWEDNYTASSNTIEKQLVNIWSEVLELDSKEISVTRSFFEMGGHSLLATVMTNKIIKHLSIEIPLSEVFQKQTIRNLADYITTVRQLGKVEESDGQNIKFLL